MSEDETKTAKAKTPPKAKKIVDEKARSVRIEFRTGEIVLQEVAKLPAEIQNRLTLHGLSQKLGDSYASISDIGESIEACQSVQERLQLGDWVKAREGAGPRPTMVVDAVVAALIADGQDVSDERKAKIVTVLSDKDERKAALKDPVIKAQYEGIRAAAAAKRAKEAKAEAKKEGGNLSKF